MDSLSRLERNYSIGGIMPNELSRLIDGIADDRMQKMEKRLLKLEKELSIVIDAVIEVEEKRKKQNRKFKSRIKGLEHSLSKLKSKRRS